MADLTWFQPTKVQEDFIRTGPPTREVVYAGGIGCIDGATLILDPVSGREERVDALRGPGHVWALDEQGVPVVAARTEPVCKGEAVLYRFATAEGAIVATGQHRFLTTDGWKTGDEIEVGAQLLASDPIPPASSSAHDPSARRADDRRCSRTARGSRSCCRPSVRSCDGRLRRDEAVCRCAAPSRDDALGCTPDVPGGERGRIRSCRSFFPSGRSRFVHAATGLPASARNLIASAFAAHARTSIPSSARSQRTSSRTGTARLLGLDQEAPIVAALALRAVGGVAADIRQPALSVPHPSPLMSKARVGVGRFFDLHVPGYENYWAAGMWHHNSGKTLSGGFKTLATCLSYPGTTVLVGRQTYRALEDTTKRVLMDGDDKPPVIPPELVEHRDDRENRVVLKNGSEILFRSLEDWNTEKIRSLNLGGAYVDECTESTLKIWLELVGRLRHPAGPGQVWGTTNPNGHDWVWKRFHPDGGLNAGPLFHQPTQSNPYLSQDYIAHLMTMPKEWVKRMVLGSFDTAAGAIWDEWRREIHVVEAAIVRRMPVRWWRFRSMDHGRRNPTAVLWFLVDNDGFLIAGAEHYEEGKLPTYHANVVKTRDAMIAPGINFGPIIGPPDVFRADQNGNTVADEYLRSAGLMISQANDNVDAGLLRVAEWLRRDPLRVFPEWHPWAGTLGPDLLGAPLLFVSDDCKALIEEIPEYVWRDLQPSQEEKQNAPEEPRKLKDHACDALRYAVMARPRPVSERPEPRDRSERRQPAFTQGLMDRQF